MTYKNFSFRKSPILGFWTVCLVSVGLLANTIAAADPGDLVLGLETHHSEQVSGFKGSKRKLVLDSDRQALDGISLAERKNNPCWVRISTEDINDSARDGEVKSLCGGKATSRKMKAMYRDNMKYGENVFITGVRVCTNNRQKRVKGIQLAGRQILSDGTLGELTSPKPASYTKISGGAKGWPVIEKAFDRAGGRDRWNDDPENPADFYNNCGEWQDWAICPSNNQIATGLIAHYEAGKEPRSITGLELICRAVWNTGNGVGAVPKASP